MALYNSQEEHEHLSLVPLSSRNPDLKTQSTKGEKGVNVMTATGCYQRTDAHVVASNAAG